MFTDLRQCRLAVFISGLILVTFSFDNYGLLLTYLLAFLRAKSSKTLKVKKHLNVSMYRVTGCRFVQVADSYTWSFQACSFTVSVKKKLITHLQNK